jgi:hypothetical protein
MKNRYASFLVLFACLFSLPMFGQAPSSLPIRFAWGESTGGTEWDNNFSSAIDSLGNQYVLGFTYSPVLNYNKENTLSDDLSTNSGSSVYLMKFSSAGNLIWKRVYNADASDERLDLTLRGNRLVFSAGFTGTKTFGDSVFTTAANGESNSLVFASLDLAGNFLWARQLNVDTAEYSGIDLALDAQNNLYFTAGFSGSISTVSGTFSTTGLGNDILYGKMSANGNMQWVKQIGSAEDDKSGKIILDRNGDLLLSGGFTSSITLGTTTLSSPVGFDWFLGKFDANTGNNLWAISEGGLGSDDRISALAVNAWNEIVVTGRFADSFQFGTQTVTSVGNDDIFVAVYRSSGAFSWVKTFGTKGENDWTSGSVGIDEAGTIWVESSVGGDENGRNYPVFYGSATDSLNLSGNQDFVFCRYSRSGSLLAIQAFGTPAYEFSQDFTFDVKTGRALIVGHHTADQTIFNQDTLLVRGGFADGFTAVVEPNLYAKTDRRTVSNTSMQMIMVMQNDVFQGNPVLTMVNTPLHGNAFVMGGNHIAYTPSGNFNGNDTIRYRICRSNECSEALLIVTHSFPTAVADPSLLEAVRIFPNPTAGDLTLQGLPEGGVHMKVVNPAGQVMFESDLHSRESQLNVQAWPGGLYYVLLYDRNTQLHRVHKFIRN